MSTRPADYEFRSPLGVAVTVGAILFWLGVLWWAKTQTIGRVQYGVLFLGGILAIYVLNEAHDALREDDYLDVAILVVTAAVMLTASAYFYTNFQDVYVRRQGYALDHEYLLARLIVLSVLYLTWREFGTVFLAIISGAIGYAYFGYLVPGEIFWHAGVPEKAILQQLVTDLYGFYGSLTQLTAAWIAPFLLYAGLLLGYGAFDLILRIAIQTAKYVRSGVAQTAVLSSAVIGSINGSYTANASMTGSFTIPTMKDSGIRGRTAAGIEAVASTSGQVLPPVMGASAFVMASFLRVPYLDIVVAGLIPAFILVFCIVVAVHYTAIREAGDQTMQFEDFFDHALTNGEKLIQGVRFGVPFAVLVYTLGVLQYTVMTSALYTVIAMMVFGIFTPVVQSLYAVSTGAESKFVPEEETGLPGPLRYRPAAELVSQLGNTVFGFRHGAIILAPIAIILAAINGAVDLFMTTGIPSALALMMMDLSGGVLLYAVLMAMAICIVMGIGMPTVAAYVIVSILIAPTLINQFGVVEMAAHYTVFYAAVLAGITPPVATAAVVAAGIAEADFWETCGVAIRIAAPLFILPIAFVYHPELVTPTMGTASYVAGGMALLGGFAIIYGLNYPLRMPGYRALPIRVLAFAAGIVIMVHPASMVQVGAGALFAAFFVGEKMLRRDVRRPAGGEVSR